VVLDIMTRIAVQVEKYQLLLPSEFRVCDEKPLGTAAAVDLAEVLRALPSPPADKELGTLVDFYTSSANQAISYENCCQELDEFGASRLSQDDRTSSGSSQSIISLLIMEFFRRRQSLKFRLRQR
jgi:hypothetical protein